MLNSHITNAREEKACMMFHKNIEMDGIKLVFSEIKKNPSSDLLVFPSSIFTFYRLPKLQWYTLNNKFVQNHKTLFMFIQENNY